MSRVARWGAGELAHVRAGVQGGGGGRGARPRVLTLTCITPGNSITSECWGDGVGPAREERGGAEWHWVNTDALNPTASPWGPSTLHPSSPRTPAWSGQENHGAAKGPPCPWWSHSLGHRSKGGPNGSCTHPARGCPPGRALFAGAACYLGKLDPICFLRSTALACPRRREGRKLEGTQREWAGDAAGGKSIFSFLS